MEMVQLIKGIAKGWRTSFRFPAVFVTHHKPILWWNYRPTIYIKRESLGISGEKADAFQNIWSSVRYPDILDEFNALKANDCSVKPAAHHKVPIW
jgi:hypothetical protein